MGVYSLLLCKAWQDVGCKAQHVLSKPCRGSRSCVCVTEQLHLGLCPSASLSPQAWSCYWRGAVELKLGSTKCNGLRRSDSSPHLRNDGCVCVDESRDLTGDGQIQALCLERGLGICNMGDCGVVGGL